MAALDVQPRLAEARPDPDTSAQLRATVARYLAANAQPGKPLSTKEQKVWARREEKYRRLFEVNRIWIVGVKVDTNLSTDAWNYTLHGSKRAAIRRMSAKTKQKKGSLEKRKKVEGLTFTLLNAYNVAIDMDMLNRDGRPNEGTPPAEVLPPPTGGPSSLSPTKESPAPPTLK